MLAALGGANDPLHHTLDLAGEDSAGLALALDIRAAAARLDDDARRRLDEATKKKARDDQSSAA